MDAVKKIIKDDINFLSFPNWVIDRRGRIKIWTIEKPHGKYEIASPFGLPQHLDKSIIYFLLYKLGQEKTLNSYTLTTTRYEIAKNVLGGTSFGKNKYERIMFALKRWKALSINFNGVFYEGDGHTIRYFSVIDEVVLRKESGELTVRFNEAYVKQLEDSKFYKLVDFEVYKKLHKSSSARLYEILIKTFKERVEWAINIQSLAESMTFEKRAGARDFFPSDVLRYLKPSVNEINKKTDLFIDFYYNKETGVCIFKKLKKPKEGFLAASRAEDKPKKKASLAKQVSACMEQFRSLPVDEQKKILDDIKKQPFAKFLPDDEARIFTYMATRKQLPLKQ